MQIVSKFPTPAMGPDLPFLGKRAMRTRWMAGATPYKDGGCRDISEFHNNIQTSLDIDICHKNTRLEEDIDKVQQN